MKSRDYQKLNSNNSETKESMTNANNDSHNPIEGTRNYVSGDEARSSSSHQFHKSSTDKNS